MVFILISKKSEETFFKTGDAYAIFAIAFFLGKEVFVSLIVSLFLASAILPFVGILYKAKYYAFVPFLVVGAIIVKENWFVVEVLFISFVINICWIILSRFFKGKQKK